MAKADARSVEELRADRETVNAQIEKLRERARDLSEKIRAKEGPIPDRTGKRSGYTIRPA